MNFMDKNDLFPTKPTQDRVSLQSYVKMTHKNTLGLGLGAYASLPSPRSTVKLKMASSSIKSLFAVSRISY